MSEIAIEAQQLVKRYDADVLAVDGVSLERFSRSVGGRPIVLWDNTLYALEVSPWYGESPARAPTHRLSRSRSWVW